MKLGSKLNTSAKYLFVFGAQDYLFIGSSIRTRGTRGIYACNFVVLTRRMHAQINLIGPGNSARGTRTGCALYVRPKHSAKSLRSQNGYRMDLNMCIQSQYRQGSLAQSVERRARYTECRRFKSCGSRFAILLIKFHSSSWS